MIKITIVASTIQELQRTRGALARFAVFMAGAQDTGVVLKTSRAVMVLEGWRQEVIIKKKGGDNE